MAREISPGDQVILERNGDRSVFVVDYVSATIIYFSPKDNPKRQNALVPINGEWKAQGSEKDRVSFLPRDESPDSGVFYTLFIQEPFTYVIGSVAAAETRKASIRGFNNLWDLLEYVGDTIRAVVTDTSTGENPALNAFLDNWWEGEGFEVDEVEDYVREMTFLLRRDYSSNLDSEKETQVLKIEIIKIPPKIGGMIKSASKR